MRTVPSGKVNQGGLRMQECGDCCHNPLSHQSCLPKMPLINFDWTALSGREKCSDKQGVSKKHFLQCGADTTGEGPRMYSNIVGVDNDAEKVVTKWKWFDPVTSEAVQASRDLINK